MKKFIIPTVVTAIAGAAVAVITAIRRKIA